MLTESFEVRNSELSVNDGIMQTKYDYYKDSIISDPNGNIKVIPQVKNFQFRTDVRVPKTGVMIVGLGGNNGTTFVCGILANKKKLSWLTRNGKVSANYHGSLTQCSTTYLGQDQNGRQVYSAFKDLIPMVDPNNLVIGGWDINDKNMWEASLRAQVMEPDLLRQIECDLKEMVPLPSVFDIAFVAPNQQERANNVLTGSKFEQMEKVRKQIREFKETNGLDKVIVLWSANTERYCSIDTSVHSTSEKLLEGLKNNHPEISPSTIYAVASILEKTPYINGSPQNTFVPGLIELAEKNGVAIMGDDFKTGQTKFKSVVADFLISSGIKLTAIASYNHLGNNDGLNLDFEKCFQSKQISKSSVIDDMVGNNPILYPNGEHPDHVVVIKYIKSVGDSKRALDEYDSDIFCNGKNIISVHNTCEDSLLAAPVMIDLVILMELFTRISIKCPDMKEFCNMNCIMSALSFLLKAPQTPKGTPVINSLFQQRACIENILRATYGLQPINHMHLEWKMPTKTQ